MSDKVVSGQPVSMHTIQNSWRTLRDRVPIGGNILSLVWRSGWVIAEKVSISKEKYPALENLGDILPRTCSFVDPKYLPFSSGAFDGFFCYETIYHNTLVNVLKSVIEIKRVLKPGGWAVLDFLSRRSSYFGKGQEIEPDTFDRTGEGSFPEHYSDLSELSWLLKEFTIFNVELQEGIENDEFHSHLCVVIQKPGQNER